MPTFTQVQEKKFKAEQITGVDFNSWYWAFGEYLKALIQYDRMSDRELMKNIKVIEQGASVEDVRASIAEQRHSMEETMKEMNRIANEQRKNSAG